MQNMTPREIVTELDKYIVGQDGAKKAVAVALRNRVRRQMVPEALRDEITPKNLMLIGPTGVGKTEIARRVARLIDAPFVKVEATKFTEVGYVGRDVESIVRDLAEAAFDMEHNRRMSEVRTHAERLATERIINYLIEQREDLQPVRRKGRKKAQAHMGGADVAPIDGQTSPTEGERQQLSARAIKQRRTRLGQLLAEHKLDEEQIEIDLGDDGLQIGEDLGGVLEFSPGMSADEMSENFQDFLDGYRSLQSDLSKFNSGRKRVRRVSVREAQRILTEEEAQKLLDLDQIIDNAVAKAESSGVVFLDEIDKIVGSGRDTGPDVSGEGVQRDLLPIVEGTVVQTRYGPVKTDHVLFIAAGAFHNAKPADLLPELQGRFPLRVELASLGQKDLRQILVEPENSLTRQYVSLMETEGVELRFSDSGIERIAGVAASLNERIEDIGARRLHTIMEQVLEDLSFRADEEKGNTIEITAEYVDERVKETAKDEDLSKFIL
jgi:ATP-dependent HslUV protease ATP-binding subunit HslU